MSSSLFYRAFVAGGSPVVECDFCRRTYYSTTMEDEDISYYVEQHKLHPDKFIPEDFDSIEYCDLGGRTYPCDCPCNAIDQYESFIWGERSRILRYLADRTTTEHDAAVVEKERVDAAVIVHTAAGKVAAALDRANRQLALATAYK